MQQENDQAYYARRAQQERERADTSPDSSAALVHHLLANAYERRLERSGAPVQLSVRL